MAGESGRCKGNNKDGGTARSPRIYFSNFSRHRVLLTAFPPPFKLPGGVKWGTCRLHYLRWVALLVGCGSGPIINPMLESHLVLKVNGDGKYGMTMITR